MHNETPEPTVIRCGYTAAGSLCMDHHVRQPCTGIHSSRCVYRHIYVLIDNGIEHIDLHIKGVRYYDTKWIHNRRHTHRTDQT